MAKADIQAGRAYVSLFVKGTAFTKGLAKAKKQLNEFGSGIMKIGAAVSGMGAAITGSLTGAILHFARVGDALDKMSLRTGVSATALAELGFAAEQSGANIEAVESALQRMQRNLGGIGPESIKTTAALEALGLSIDNVRGLSPENQFQLIAERIGDINDPAQRAAAAMAVFGQGGRQLLPMLESIRELRQEARDLGIAPDQESVAAAAQITDAINRVRRVIGAAIFEIGASIAPMVADVLARFLQVVLAVRKFVVENRNLVVIAAKVGAVLLAVGSAIVAVGAGFIGAGLAIGGVLSVINAVYASFALMKTITLALAGSLFVLRNAVIAARVAFVSLTVVIASVRTAIISLAVASKAIAISLLAVKSAVIGARAAMVSYAVALGSIRAAITGVTVASLAATIATSALATVGAVLGALTSPALLAAAAVAAVGYAAFRTAGGMQGMSSAARSAFAETRSVASTFATQFMELFGKLRQTVGDTFAGIVDAVRGGDLALAGQIAMVGLRLVIAQGLEAIHGLFGETIGTLVGQILGGDLSGAWSTLGSTMLASWANVANGIVELFTSAASSVVSLWRKMSDEIINGMLSLAGEGGIFGKVFEQFSGVNVKEEMERAKRLEQQRRDRGLAPQDDDIASQIAAGTYRDPGIAAMEERMQGIIKDATDLSQDMTDAAQMAVDNAVEGQTKAASANVKNLTDQLARLRAEAAAKIEAGRIGKPEEDQRSDSGGQARLGLAGRASVATNSLAALASMASAGPEQRQIRAIARVEKVGEKQLEKLEEVVTNIRNLGLFHP